MREKGTRRVVGGDKSLCSASGGGNGGRKAWMSFISQSSGIGRTTRGTRRYLGWQPGLHSKFRKSV